MLLERNDAHRLDLELGAFHVTRSEQNVPYRAHPDRGAGLTKGVCDEVVSRSELGPELTARLIGELLDPGLHPVVVPILRSIELDSDLLSTRHAHSDLDGVQLIGLVHPVGTHAEQDGKGAAGLAYEHPVTNLQPLDVVERNPSERVFPRVCRITPFSVFSSLFSLVSLIFLFGSGECPLPVKAPLGALDFDSRRTALDHRALEVVDEPDRDGLGFTGTGDDERRESQEGQQDFAHGDLQGAALPGRICFPILSVDQSRRSALGTRQRSEEVQFLHYLIDAG